MNHQQYKERIELLYYDELTGRDRAKTEAHMRSCEECRTLFDELKKLHGVLAQYTPVEVNDRLLSDARVELQSALRDERRKQSWWERLAGVAAETIMPQYKVAFVGVATIATGFFLGYLTFRTTATQPVQSLPQVQTTNIQERPMLPEEGQITNVKFLDSDARDGEVEFTFDAVLPMHLKGKVNDPQIQQALSYALLNEQNPGVRLRTVSAMASEQAANRDEDVKHVLITALTSDDNVGVRKEALQALQRFPFDNEIKKSFMDVLVHDSNSAIRIAAINALDSSKSKGTAGNQDLLNILKDKMKSDNNEYIRIRAKAVLQEINQ